MHPFGEAAADVARLQPRAVDRRHSDATFPQGIEHAAGDGRQEPLCGLLEGRVVGRGLDPDRRPEVGMILEVRRRAAAIEARASLAHRAAQELGPRELPGPGPTCMPGRRPQGRLVGDPEHPARETAGIHTS